MIQNQFNSELIYSATSVDLFHFIGKILYSKRAELETNDWKKCEQCLRKQVAKKWSRPFPPKDNVHDLLELANISGSRVSFEI